MRHPRSTTLWRFAGLRTLGSILAGFLVWASFSLSPPTARGGAILFFSDTGHYYERVDVAAGITWDEARDQAAERLYRDLPGHLVTIGSEEESAFIASKFLRITRGGRYPNAFLAWVGGFQPPESAEPNGNWQWITGETMDFTSWDLGEPDNAMGDENAMCVNGPAGNQGTWVDLPSSWRLTAYLVEYEESDASETGDKSPWRTSALDIPQPGGDMQAARDPLGRIYVPLGKDPERGASRQEVVRFDESTRSWQFVADLGVARSFSAVAADYRGRIYCIGGRDTGVLETVERYDPETNHWTFIAPLPEPRWGAKAVADASATSIYVLGGRLGGGGISATRTVLRYDVESGVWEQAPPMKFARMEFGAALGADGKIYAVGGSAGLGVNGTRSTVERFEPGSERWTTLAPLRSHPSDVGVAVGDACGFIYAIGGWDPGFSRAVERYVPERNEWEPCPPLGQAKSRLAGALSHTGRIYVFGGDSAPDVTPRIEFTFACAPPALTKVWRVSVKFVLDEDGRRAAFGDLNSDEEVRAQVDMANRILCGPGGAYTLQLTEVVDLPSVSQWFAMNCHEGERDAFENEARANPELYAWKSDAINVYVAGQLSGCGGICSSPRTPSEIIILGQRLSVTTLLHEVGHYFGLCHTQGCPCSVCGEGESGSCHTVPVDDEISDTLPDLACWTNQDIAFHSFGTDYESLTPDQQARVDDTYFNVMSYHPANPERSRLTADQIHRMIDVSGGSRLNVVGLLDDAPCNEEDPGDRGAVVDYFRRGDANADGVVDLGDPVFTLIRLFSGGEESP